MSSDLRGENWVWRRTRSYERVRRVSWGGGKSAAAEEEAAEGR